MKNLSIFIFILLNIFEKILIAQTCAPVLVKNSDDILCEGNELHLTASITLPPSCMLNNDGTAMYKWTDPNGVETETMSNTLYVPASVAGTYFVQVKITQNPNSTDLCSCNGWSAYSNSITVNPAPVLPTFENSNTFLTVCGGQVNIVPTNINDINGVLEWRDENNTIVYVGNNFTTPNLTKDTEYKVTHVVGECSGPEVIVLIDVTDLPQANLENGTSVSTLCPGESVQLNVTNSSPEYIVKWFDDNGNLIHLGVEFTTPPIDSVTKYHVYITNNICESPEQIVQINPGIFLPPNVNSSHINEVCYNDKAILHATSENGTQNPLFNWYYPDGTFYRQGNNIETFPVTSDTYFMAKEVTDNCISDYSDLFHIVVNPAPDAPKLLSNSPVCLDDTILISWNNLSANESLILTTPDNQNFTITNNSFKSIADNSDKEGYYQACVITDKNCKSAQSDIYITINDTPSIFVDKMYSDIFQNEELQLTAEGANTYSWQPKKLFSPSDAETVIFKSDTVKEYNLKVIGYNSVGCKSEVNFKINVKPDTEIPKYNFFGINDDYFHIPRAEMNPDLKVEIIDDNGNLVFSSDRYSQNPWTGKYQQNKVPDGIYIYIIKNPYGEIIEEQAVLVVR